MADRGGPKISVLRGVTSMSCEGCMYLHGRTCSRVASACRTIDAFPDTPIWCPLGETAIREHTKVLAKTGMSRLMKVLFRSPEGVIEGHRAYPIALHREPRRRAIVVALTSSEWEGYRGGRFYLVEERDSSQHPWVVGEVREVPRESQWKLAEAEMDDRAGHVDPF